MGICMHTWQGADRVATLLLNLVNDAATFAARASEMKRPIEAMQACICICTLYVYVPYMYMAM